MFGLDFLFAWALWALPLAGLPVLLHMLFRRKSPVLLFPTLRFIKSSIQETAARRKIQRWILLACRMLLLLLLIWAIAQPVRILASGWFTSGQSVVAAVVVDTSHSMQLRQQEVTLLDKANDIVADLLRSPLKDARVAIFRSQPPPPDQPEKLLPAAKIQSEWAPLKPEPALSPLVMRCAAAVNFLARQQAAQKWLVVISDLQSREFPSPLPALEDGRTVLFDLHPEEPGSAGITRVAVEPEQPIPGIGAEAVVEVTGHAGDARALSLSITKLDGSPLKQVGPLMASFDSGGRTRVRVPLKEGLPVEKWLLLTARLQAEDSMNWDNVRSQLVELPSRQAVSFFEAPTRQAASDFIRLALDPWEGKVSAWPLEVKKVTQLTGRENVVVLPLTQWPDQQRLNRLRGFVSGGGCVIFLLQPGLEQSWGQLTARQKSDLLALLPSQVLAAAPSGVFHPVAPAKPDRILAGLTDPSFRLNQLTIRRFVPFAAPGDGGVSTLLYLSPASGEGRSVSSGLLYRRGIGDGVAYTLATLPDKLYISEPAHPVFLPLLVGMALRPPDQREAQNIEIGQSLVLSGNRFAPYNELEVQGPDNARYRVRPTTDASGRKFIFEQTASPGLYYWRTVNDGAAVALGNVQLPAGESDLIYKPADAVLPGSPNCLVVHSFAELQSTVARLNEPEPRWTWAMALVLLLMCFEALLGSMSQLWKPISLKSLLPRVGASA